MGKFHSLPLYYLDGRREHWQGAVSLYMLEDKEGPSWKPDNNCAGPDGTTLRH
eukprot:CAMPEP_0172562182 /NCGR_PEP_ID=MMETSP1067-20121228/95907_1 /TAXON_ID=265564 ORGANISM="Thalassiosira punctigera, Strain Tpunct2005C2" /NCGR_SAMPLE_ID=MMETSP1067 /ASSEMBLY_ACC=CAM_ASM_000444 /LENGTH=52 /DNA_ID=CAMNT_0013352365 /DNA_START=131 /DNA_END=286 /DNA_ORIENTATION=+